MGAICLRLQWVLHDRQVLNQDGRSVSEMCPHASASCGPGRCDCGRCSGRCQIEPQFHNTEFWHQYHLVVLQPSCTTLSHLIPDLQDAVSPCAGITISRTELSTLWVTEQC